MKTKKIVVEVTQEDINTGEWATAFNCPVAKAIQRKTGHRIGCTRTYFIHQEKPEYQGFMPAAAGIFIGQFDSEGGKEKVSPFSFEIEVPDTDA